MTERWPGGRNLGALADAVVEAAGKARIGVVITQIEGDVRNVFVSEQAADIFGRPRADMEGQAVLSNVGEPERTRLAAIMREVATGKVDAPPVIQIEARRADGRSIPVEVTTSTFRFEGKLAAVSFIADVSDRRSLEQSEARFRSFVERAPDAVLICDPKRVVYGNSQAVALVGDAFDFPRTWSEILAPEAVAKTERYLSEVLAGQVDAGYHPFRIRRINGRELVLEVACFAIEHEGKPMVIAFARDITARRRLEERLANAEKVAALGTLAAGVGHEINNPLMYAVLNLEALERLLRDAIGDEGLRRRALKHLEDARHGAGRVETIVRQMSQLARSHGGERRMGDVGRALAGAIDIVRHRIPDTIDLRVQTTPMPRVWGEEGQLQQVFINLLVNAVQSLEQRRTGTVEIRVSRDDTRVIVEFRDDGAGIPEDVVSRVFDPFFTTKPAGQGTGLGLPISNGIVAALGGDIALDSAVGRGTSVRVRLPVAEDDGPLSQPVIP